MIWARGHKNDCEFFAAEAGDNAWNYNSVLNILSPHRKLARRAGPGTSRDRGSYLRSARPYPNPVAPAMIAAAGSLGIRIFEDHNGCMMEGNGGAALNNLRIRDGGGFRFSARMSTRRWLVRTLPCFLMRWFSA
jgi:choline dehydrogenase